MFSCQEVIEKESNIKFKIVLKEFLKTYFYIDLNSLLLERDFSVI